MKENNKKRKSLKIISQNGDIKTKKEIKVEIGRLRKMKVWKKEEERERMKWKNKGGKER